MRIRILLVILMHADPDPACNFDSDVEPAPDPTFHSNADPDPDPTFQFDADPEPQHCRKLPKLYKKVDFSAYIFFFLCNQAPR
jgi:hypothetical protein